MAKKVKSESGSIFCSYCGTAVQEEDDNCPSCGEGLEDGLVDGVLCPSCGNPVDPMEDVCPECRKDLTDTAPSPDGDEEFLSKLLGWGDETEGKLEKKIEEKRKAMEVFKKVADGAGGKKKEENIEEKYEVEADISYDLMVKPFEDVVNSAEKSLDEIKKNIMEVKKEVGEVNDD